MKKLDVLIDDLVEIRCLARAQMIYGSPLPKHIQAQIEWELDAISDQDAYELYVVSQSIVERSGKLGYRVGTRGCISASLVAFLLGITQINPLPAHYVCPACKHSVFSVGEQYDIGFDLPDAICQECGAKMRKDGFNIPAETFFGIRGEKQPDLGLNLSGDYHKLAVEHLEELCSNGDVFGASTLQELSKVSSTIYVKKYCEENGLEIDDESVEYMSENLMEIKREYERLPGSYFFLYDKDDIPQKTTPYQVGEDRSRYLSPYGIKGLFKRIDLLKHDVPTLIRKLQLSTGVDPATIPMDDKQTLELLTSGDTIGIPEFGHYSIREIIKKAKPATLTDLIKISGITHGTGTWKENAESLIESGRASIKDVIALRDDVMQLLMKKGMCPENAYEYMELVRRGKLGEERNIENWEIVLNPHSVDDWKFIFDSYGIDDWYFESAKKIKYLFPKAHATSYTIQSFILAWYKVNYPIHFYTIMLNYLDEDDVFCVSDFEKDFDDIESEIIALQNKEVDYYWSDNKSEIRIRALEMIKDVYSHGYSFQPLRESMHKRFHIGTDSTILTTFLK